MSQLLAARGASLDERVMPHALVNPRISTSQRKEQAMAFMRPVYTNEAFLVGENHHGEGAACPFSVWCNLRDNDCAYAAKHDKDVQTKVIEKWARENNLVVDTVEIVHDKWWCRLSAPGYMDATDWDGPHDDETAARMAIQRNYEVDPDTGDDLDDDEEE